VRGETGQRDAGWRRGLGAAGSWMRRVWLAVGTLLAAGLAACVAAHTDPRTLFLAPWQPPAGQRCAVRKKRIPDLSQVIDTAALARSVARFGPGRVVATLAFWPEDTAWHEEYGPRPDSMVIVETTFPDSLEAALRAALLDAVRARRPERLLIRLDLGGHPWIRLAPALECAPAVRSQADLRRYSAALQSFSAPPGRALVQFLVRPDGSLTAFEVRTSSGDPEFDRAALSTVPLLRFTPGLINHLPAPGLVRFPVTVRAMRRGPPPPPTAADCPKGRVVEILNPLSAAVLVYAFDPDGAQLLGTAAAAARVRLALSPASSGYGFVQWADTATLGHSEGDLKKVRWTVKCGVP
jgi:TonB family protein